MATSTSLLSSFTCRNFTTWDRRLYFPSEERHTEDFFALKNPTVSAGFEPANLGTKGQLATSRPPKPLLFIVCHIFTAVRDVPIKVPPYNFASWTCRLHLAPGNHCSLKNHKEQDTNVIGTFLGFHFQGLPLVSHHYVPGLRCTSMWLWTRDLIQSEDNSITLLTVYNKICYNC